MSLSQALNQFAQNLGRYRERRPGTNGTNGANGANGANGTN